MKIRGHFLIFLATIPLSHPCLSQQSKPSPDALQAIWSGNIETLQEIISRDPGWVNTYRIGSNPPIVEAAQLGKVEVVGLLVTNKANINAHGVWGKTALHFAADNGDAKMVEFLLKHKADVNSVDEHGFTPIVQSIKSVEVLKLLLAHGADINAHGGKNTLYSQAIGNPQSVGPGVVDFILTNGVDVTVSGDEGFYQAVLFYNDTNLVKRLVPYYAKSTRPEGMVLLHGALEISLAHARKEMALAIISACFELQTNSLQKAVVLGDIGATTSLLSNNPAFANTRDFFGWTPLHLAALLGNTQLAESLISNKANVDSKDDIGNTPLHWAAFFGFGDLVAQLLRHGANVAIPGNGENYNDTALDFAIRQGFTSIATMLLTNGANLGPYKWWRDTPLHEATAKENVELMKLLISRGADINAVRGGNYKQSPLDIAVTGNSPEAVRLLLASGSSLKTQMQTQSGSHTTLFHLWAAGSGNSSIADQLLAAGCDLNATNGEGQIPLHIALGKWRFAYKADPNRTKTNATWPSDFGIEDSNKEAAQWLFSHNANVSAKDNNGQTPLHLIVTRGNLRAIEALLESGADVNATDMNGKTALALLEDCKGRHSHAVFVDFKAVEKLLLDHGAKGPIITPESEPGLRFR